MELVKHVLAWAVSILIGYIPGVVISAILFHISVISAFKYSLYSIPITILVLILLVAIKEKIKFEIEEDLKGREDK